MDLHNLIFGILAVLFIATVGTQLYTSSVTYGGYTMSGNSDLAVNVDSYNTRMNASLVRMELQTKALSQQLGSLDITAIVTIATLAMNTLQVMWDSVDVFKDVILSSGGDLQFFDIPPVVQVFGIMFVFMTMTMGLVWVYIKYRG